MQVLKNGVEDYCWCFPDHVPELLLQATTLARLPWPCMRPWSPPLALLHWWCRILYCFLWSMPLARLIRWVTAFSGYEYIMPSYCWWLTCSGWGYTLGVCDPWFLVICLISFLLLFLDRCL
jgi:hypothetical protein